MFITQLLNMLNRASSMMWAAIKKKKKKKKHNACSHASSASNVHAFSTLYTKDEMKKDKLAKD